jgi:hypothetical protein
MIISHRENYWQSLLFTRCFYGSSIQLISASSGIF